MRKLCPCMRRHLCPSGTLGSQCAASIVNSLKISIVSLRYAKKLVRLQTQAPAWMLHAKLDSTLRVRRAVWPIHWLQEKMSKRELFKSRWVGIRLRKHKLQFMPASLHQVRSGFRTHADPVDPRWCLNRPICLHRNPKVARMQGFNQRRIQLKQRLAAGANHKPFSLITALRPLARHRIRQRLGRLELPSARPIGTHKVRIAELAHR